MTIIFSAVIHLLMNWWTCIDWIGVILCEWMVPKCFLASIWYKRDNKTTTLSKTQRGNCPQDLVPWDKVQPSEPCVCVRACVRACVWREHGRLKCLPLLCLNSGATCTQSWIGQRTQELSSWPICLGFDGDEPNWIWQWTHTECVRQGTT